MQGESNYKWALEATKWGADFMVKSVKSNKLLLHVGDIQADHAYIGRAEDYPQVKRDVYWCKPGPSHFMSVACNTRGIAFWRGMLWAFDGCVGNALLQQTTACRHTVCEQ